MLKKSLLITSILVSSAGTVSAQSQTQNGATVGGVAGAVIGGIIGHQNDETPEGALIGGAVGAIAGGLIGKAQDNRLNAERQAYQAQAYAQQQQVYAQRAAVAASGVSMADVVNMCRSGVNESVIMSHIQSKGVQRRLEVSDIIALHQQGVSDTLITVMQSAPLATDLVAPRVQTTVVNPAPTVIVEERPVYYHPPVIVHEYYRPIPRHHYHYHRGSSVHIGF